MKKQIFLISSLLFSSSVFMACCTTSTTQANGCAESAITHHGKTFKRIDNSFQNGTPLFASMFNSDVLKNLKEDDKKWNFETTIFGGKNRNNSAAGSYYFPYGHSTFNFDGTVTPQVHAGAFAWNDITHIAVKGAGVTQAFTLKFDSNTKTNKILPWNFGITYAALFQPFGRQDNGSTAYPGSGLITNPEFKSTVTPTYKYSHIGAGLALRCHLSDEAKGFWAGVSTSVERVRSQLCLNEKKVAAKKEITATNFPKENDFNAGPPIVGNRFGAQTLKSTEPLTTFTAEDANLPILSANARTPVGSINRAYLKAGNGTFFPVDDTVVNGGGKPPKDVTAAFQQAQWNYGKIKAKGDCNIGFADVELKLGYNFLVEDNAYTSWFVGAIIPTGKKPCADYIAPAVIGNGKHFGLMTGSTLELSVYDNENFSIKYRMDSDLRYLFKNTQKRSFDLKNNEFSRYMMVWKDKASYKKAIDVAKDDVGAIRHYTPGINVFTKNMNITPGFQAKLNSAFLLEGEHFRGELGWNIDSKTREKTCLASKWVKPAFADSSYAGGVALNKHRKIYNDAQLMSVNAVPLIGTISDTPDYKNIIIPNSMAFGSAALFTPKFVGQEKPTERLYDEFAILESDINYDSAASPAAIVHTPYLTLGYAFESDCKPMLAIGGSYEFSQGNEALDKWMVWGKFEFAF